jgi:hypothetical protein
MRGVSARARGQRARACAGSGLAKSHEERARGQVLQSHMGSNGFIP